MILGGRGRVEARRRRHRRRSAGRDPRRPARRPRVRGRRRGPRVHRGWRHVPGDREGRSRRPGHAGAGRPAGPSAGRPGPAAQVAADELPQQRDVVAEVARSRSRALGRDVLAARHLAVVRLTRSSTPRRSMPATRFTPLATATSGAGGRWVNRATAGRWWTLFSFTRGNSVRPSSGTPRNASARGRRRRCRREVVEHQRLHLLAGQRLVDPRPAGRRARRLAVLEELGTRTRGGRLLARGRASWSSQARSGRARPRRACRAAGSAARGPARRGCAPSR